MPVPAWDNWGERLFSRSKRSKIFDRKVHPRTIRQSGTTYTPQSFPKEEHFIRNQVSEAKLMIRTRTVMWIINGC